jgi:hypothetical protein
MVIYGYEVDGDIWIWSGWWYMDMKWMVIYGYEVPGGALNPSSTELPRLWSPWESSPSRKKPHGRTGNQTRYLMISSQKLWPLDHKLVGRNWWMLGSRIIAVLGRIIQHTQMQCLEKKNSGILICNLAVHMNQLAVKGWLEDNLHFSLLPFR